MNKSAFTALVTALVLSACTDDTDTLTKSDKEVSQVEQVLVKEDKEIVIKSLAELDALFQKLEYTKEFWDNGSRKVPRITFESVLPQWKEISDNLPVAQKKSIFMRLFLPLVLMSNEAILAERKLAEIAELDAPELVALAIKYRVLKVSQEQGELPTALTIEQKRELLTRVNIIPPSLALAQAAEESGWGTSRFAHEGNAFFGQWDFSGKGMKPLQQREELGNYGVARFDSPYASVEGYMLNINSGAAYQDLRDLRSQKEMDNETFSGDLLAGTLLKYSERGEAYVESLRSLINYNKLTAADDAYLSTMPRTHLVRE